MEATTGENWLQQRAEGLPASHPDFNSLEAARQAGRTHAVCFGDSHVGVFWHIEQRRLVPHAWFDACPITGATAHGLGNPSSRTNALSIFRQGSARWPAAS